MYGLFRDNERLTCIWNSISYNHLRYLKKNKKGLEPELYGDLIYKLKKNCRQGRFFWSVQKIIVRYKRIGYNINIMRQSACLTQSWLITLLPSLIARRWVGRQTRWWPRHKAILVGLGRSLFVCCLAHRGSTVGFRLLQCSSGVVRHPGDLRVSVATRSCRVLIIASS